MRFHISKTSGGDIDFLTRNDLEDYFIEINTLEELIELTRKDGQNCTESSIILHNRSDGLYLEIYDTYRE